MYSHDKYFVLWYWIIKSESKTKHRVKYIPKPFETWFSKRHFWSLNLVVIFKLNGFWIFSGDSFDFHAGIRFSLSMDYLKKFIGWPIPVRFFIQYAYNVSARTMLTASKLYSLQVQTYSYMCYVYNASRKFFFFFCAFVWMKKCNPSKPKST